MTMRLVAFVALSRNRDYIPAVEVALRLNGPAISFFMHRRSIQMRDLGKVYMTQGIDIARKESEEFAENVDVALARFQVNDWGDISENDAKANNEDIAVSENVCGAYYTCKGKIWITTDFYSRNDYEKHVGKIPESDIRERIPVTTILWPYEH